MTVYVDDMYRHEIGKLGRMKDVAPHCRHDDELLAMVREIGVNPKWIQHPGTRDEHFDIAISKRAAAIAAGAVPITYRECGAMNKRRKVTGELGSPTDAIAWLDKFPAARHRSRVSDGFADSSSREKTGAIADQSPEPQR